MRHHTKDANQRVWDIVSRIESELYKQFGPGPLFEDVIKGCNQ